MGIEIAKPSIAPGGAVGVQTQVSGYYYASPVGVTTGTATATLNDWQALPFWVPAAANFDRIAVEVTTGIASGVVRLGVVGDTGGMFPGPLVLDAGTVDASSPGLKEITIDLTLNPGVYWLTNCSQVAAPGLRTFTLGSQMIGTTAPSSSSITIGYKMASVSGAFPATYTPSGISSSSVRVFLRKS